MKTLRIFLQFLFVVANVVAVVLLIVSAYSDRVSPETSMTLSYRGEGGERGSADNKKIVMEER